MKLKQTLFFTLVLNYIHLTSLGRYKSYLLEIKNSFLETFIEYKEFLTNSLGKENTFIVYGNYAMGAVDNLIETKTELEDLLDIFEKELSVYVRLNKFNSNCYTILPSNFSPATLHYVKERLPLIQHKDLYKTDEFFNNDFTLKKLLINEYNEYISDFKIHTENTMEHSKTIISQVYSMDGFKINLEEHIEQIKVKINKTIKVIEKLDEKNNKKISKMNNIKDTEERNNKAKAIFKKRMPTLTNIQSHILTYFDNRKNLDVEIKKAIKDQIDDDDDDWDFKKQIDMFLGGFSKYKKVDFAVSRYLETIGMINNGPKKITEKKIAEKYKIDLQIKNKKYEPLIEDENIKEIKQNKIKLEDLEQKLLNNLYKLFKENVVNLKGYVCDMNLFLEGYRKEIQRGYYISQYNLLLKKVEDELDKIK